MKRSFLCFFVSKRNATHEQRDAIESLTENSFDYERHSNRTKAISGEKSLTMDEDHRRQLVNVSQPLYNRRNELRGQLISLRIISARYTIRTRFLCHSSDEEFGTCFYLFTFLFVYRWRSFEFPVTIKEFRASSYFLIEISSSVEGESKGCQCCRIFANSIVHRN